MRCILDTNLLISAAITPGNKPYQILHWVVSNATLFTSDEIYEKLKQVIVRKKFEKYFTNYESRDHFLNLIFKFSTFATPREKIDHCRDPKDNKFLELAVAINADFLIAGDEDLYILKSINNTVILSTNVFFDDFIK